eukprot:TRINITY_DN3138_c0_g1_i1.p1 TRINITY_DN3138_c0_g1~~TRINITY_DN3138_c0_g1_i1.p1  ORF type:complete len:460 (+),score=83.99 TRINITY_DN3138_c0_g1_i1:174-1553(+)
MPRVWLFFFACFAIAATRVFAHQAEANPQLSIYQVFPGLVPVNQDTNLTVGVNFLLANPNFDCIRCAFGGTYQNYTTMGEYYPPSTVYCYFPSEVEAVPNSPINVWMLGCDKDEPQSNTWPLFLYDTLPVIDEVVPNTIYSTGGQYVAITLKDSFDALQVSNIRVACALSTFPYYKWDASPIEGAYKFICSTNLAPEGPANITLVWTAGDDPNYLSSTPYPVEVQKSSIVSYSPMSGCVLGGVNITFTMETPVVQGPYEYVCEFRDSKTGDFLAWINAEASGNGSVIVCPSFPWQGQEADLYITNPWHNIQLTNPVQFKYYNNCALEVSPSTVCAIGRVPVYITGQGFPETTPLSELISVDVLNVQLYPNDPPDYSPLNTALLNSTTMMFLTEMGAYSLDSYFIAVRNHAGNSTSYPLFEITNTNDCLSSVSPTVLNVSGGQVVTVEAYQPAFGDTAFR